MAEIAFQNLNTLRQGSRTVAEYTQKVTDAKLAAAEAVANGALTSQQASDQLGLSPAAVDHLATLYNQQGHDGLQKNLVKDEKAAQGRAHAFFSQLMEQFKRAMEGKG